MKVPIVNVHEVKLEAMPRRFQPSAEVSERFELRIARLSEGLGARKLGYNVTQVPPGKRAFPFHNHHVNEEMFFILDGTGEIRIGEKVHPVRPGDVIACPPGGPETAHQIVNTGSSDLRYLAVSTNLMPEVAEYPDSGKFLVADRGPGGSTDPAEMFRFIGRAAASLDYWDGE